MVKEQKIPDATIERVALYMRPLERILKEGIQLVSSEQLANMCNVNPAQVRKDFSFFGEFGVRGVGYDVNDLLRHIKEILASDREWKLGIVGLDDMGMALVQNKNFARRGYRFVAAFDSDPRRIGQCLPMGLVVQPVSKIKELAKVLRFEIGVITSSPAEAQRMADLFFESGIMAVLNFSPIHLRKPDCCLVHNVDFTLNLDHLAYQLNKR
jgi:redox-sensing transcriptional repressor